MSHNLSLSIGRDYTVKDIQIYHLKKNSSNHSLKENMKL
jgi:hypothetical protein